MTHKNSWLKSFVHLFYPRLCLHCDEPLTKDVEHFCEICLSLLELINPKERCPRCFSKEYSSKYNRCGHCQTIDWPLKQTAAVFDHKEAAATFVQRIKYSNQPYLAKAAAAYMAVQFYELKWPIPDIIVPVPISWMRKIERGYNQSFELAAQLALFLERPVSQVLKRKNGGYSQAGLGKTMRLSMPLSLFYLKKEECIEDKIVLLIDDVATTGSTLCRCAEVLQEGYPDAIYGLTLSQATL